MIALLQSARLTRRFSAVRRHMKRQRAMATLSGLDERLLRDIGLSRPDIEAMRRMW